MNHWLKRILSKSIPLVITGTFLVSSMAIPGAFAEDLSPDDPLSGSSGTQLTTVPWTASQAFVQYQDTEQVDGIVTTVQNAANYDASYDIPTDAVMVYADNVGASDNLLDSWADNLGDRKLCMMISANRSNSDEYYTTYGGNDDNIQIDKNGNSISSMFQYRVPTQNYIDYKWAIIQKHCTDYPQMDTVVLEEPEPWQASGYSNAFKAEWQAYYGEAWQDPSSSTANQYKASRLKVYLWERFLETLATRTKQNFPNVKVLVATHSVNSYNLIGMVAGTGHYTELDGIDGVIGQTWSDTAVNPIPYAGDDVMRVFESSFVGYASYVDTLTGDQTLYTLADPFSDAGTESWDFYRDVYKQTVVSQLLQQDIQRFQETIWQNRSFSSDVPADYRTAQLNVFTALKELSGKASALYGGTAGIGVALSDSLSWQYGSGKMADSDSGTGFYGMTIPLIEKGVPITIPSLEQVKTASDLSGLKLLILSYDCQKPISAQTNQAIADWVKAGGVLLYLGGKDDYSSLSGTWWQNAGKTPMTDLFSKLGLTGISTGNVLSGSSLSWKGESGYGSNLNGASLSSTNRSYTYTFSGSGFTTILKTGLLSNYNVGIRADAGQGKVIAVGLPSSIYGTSSQGPNMLRDLVKYAMSFTDRAYLESDIMAIQRGNYIAAQATGSSQLLNGPFVDLFEETLPIVGQKYIENGKYAFLKDISSLQTAGTPRFVHSGGSLQGDVTETATTTSFTFTGPEGTLVSTRLLGNGKYPQQVSVTKNNQPYYEFYSQWDNETNSLLLGIDGEGNTPLTVTVTWGTASVADGQKMKYEETTVLTNNSNQDAAYLVSNTAYANDSIRYCDLTGQLVYKFDLADHRDFTVIYDIFSNYIVEVSDHNGDYVTAYDYRDISDVHVTDGSNRTNLKITAADYGITNELYIRISNTDVTKGWGASIVKFIIRYLVPDHATLNSTTIATNNQNLDSAYLVRNTASANDAIRYCDLTGELVYKFDLSGKIRPSVSLQVGQNYVISVSNEDGNWTEAYNYKTMTNGGWVQNEANLTTYTLSPDDYGYTDGILYVKLSNTTPTQGWGGSLHNITIRYYEPTTPTVTPVSVSIAANNQSKDQSYIVRNTGSANDGLRFCDQGGQLVYRFDLTGLDAASVTLYVAQNYVLSVSDHDGDWTEAYNYKTISSGGWVQDTSNRTSYTFTPSSYDLDGVIYIMLSNTETDKGWGGTVDTITIQYNQIAY